jgi:hypothetical protein
LQKIRNYFLVRPYPAQDSVFRPPSGGHDEPTKNLCIGQRFFYMNRRTLILSSLTIAALIASALVLQPRTTNVPRMTASAAIPVAAPITTTDAVSEKTAIPVSSQRSDTSLTPPTSEVTPARPAATTTAPAQTATLVVGTARYTFDMTANETVAEAMYSLTKSSSGFQFTSRDYPGMGIFIESINGIANTKEASWFLYINGKSADSGASQTTVHPGDTIEWKLEQQ